MTARRRVSNCWRAVNLGRLPEFFEVKRYKVTVERRKNKYATKMVSLSEAVVVVKIDGRQEAVGFGIDG